MPETNNQTETDTVDVLCDTELNNIIKNFSASLDDLENDLNYVTEARKNTQLTTEEKIKLDTFMTYANSTLYWMYLKLQGTDMSKHYIMHDLARAKELLAREKEVNDSLSAHRLDMSATKRFIAAGLHTRFVEMDGVMVTEAQYKRSLVESESAKQ